MIIVFLEKPKDSDGLCEAFPYKDMKELEEDISQGTFCLEGGDSIFIAEMLTLKEYIYKATLVEKKSKK